MISLNTGDDLRNARELGGWTQKDFAEAVGVGVPTLRRWEQQTALALDAAERCAAVFNNTYKVYCVAIRQEAFNHALAVSAMTPEAATAHARSYRPSAEILRTELVPGRAAIAETQIVEGVLDLRRPLRKGFNSKREVDAVRRSNHKIIADRLRDGTPLV